MTSSAVKLLTISVRRATYCYHLEQLRGYAPELNPAEGIWNYLKRVELKNLCCQSVSHLYL
jgi:transposase